MILDILINRFDNKCISQFKNDPDECCYCLNGNCLLDGPVIGVFAGVLFCHSKKIMWDPKFGNIHLCKIQW